MLYSLLPFVTFAPPLSKDRRSLIGAAQVVGSHQQSGRLSAFQGKAVAWNAAEYLGKFRHMLMHNTRWNLSLDSRLFLRLGKHVWYAKQDMM